MIRQRLGDPFFRSIIGFLDLENKIIALYSKRRGNDSYCPPYCGGRFGGHIVLLLVYYRLKYKILLKI